MASDSSYIFNYIDDMWSTMPEPDQATFANTWKAYEMTYGDVWMQMFERQMALNIDYLPLYNIRRWQKYTFDETTKVSVSASYTSPQDMSQGLDLSSRYLVKISYDTFPAIEMDLRGRIPGATTITEIVTKINQTLGATVAYSLQNGQLLQLKSPTTGPTSSLTFYQATDADKDSAAIVLGFDPAVDLPKKYPQFPYAYYLGDKTIVSVPFLQNKIKQENITVKLEQGLNFAVEFGTAIASFSEPPLQTMWAPDTFVNLETPYNNFGFLLGIYDNNTADYLKAVKGLWYAYWTGPSPENIKRSLYLLFGLPTASSDGVVSSVTVTTITLTYATGSVEIFQIPKDLTSIVVSGDSVTKFQPLVSGIQVFDKVNYPGFVAKEVGRYGVQPFLTQNATRGSGADTDETKALTMLEANTYLPQIDVSTFISGSIKLANVRTFLSTLQPKSRTYLLQILVGSFREVLGLLDEGYTTKATALYPHGRPSLELDVTLDVTPNLDSNVNTFASQADLDAAEESDYTGMQLDEGTAWGDRIEIEVRQGPHLVGQPAPNFVEMFSYEG